MVGQQIGKYRVLDRIGKGGMGTVYRALDEMLHRDVAIKVLNAELNDPEVAKRFRAEAITVARLSHPGIATIYELFEHQGEWLMVMEFVRGETLESMVTRMGPLSAQRSAELCMQALAALAHAHSMGVVHRDLKPANLMITENGTVKVMDFGIARVSGSEHLTNAGFMMGTPAYMAPEQVRGGDVDARADLYAMGVVFYRLATAKLPFKGETAFAMVQSQVNEPPTPIGLVRTGLPPWVEEIVMRALAKPVEQRFQSAAEFHEAFARCLAGLPLSSMYAVGETTMTPSRMPSGGYPTRPTASASFPIPTTTPYATATPYGTTTPYGNPPAGTNPNMPAYDTDATMLSASGSTQRPGTTGTTGTTGKAGAGATIQKKPLPIMWIGVASAAVLAIVVAAVVFGGGGGSTPEPTPIASATPEPTPPAVTTTPDPNAAAATVTDPATIAANASTGAGRGTTVGPPGTPAVSPTPTLARGVAPTPSPGLGRGATPTATPVPGASAAPGAPGADPALAFSDVKLVQVDGKRAIDKDIVVNFGGGQITLMPKSGSALATLPYKRFTRATYVRARDPKWDAKLASPPEGFSVGGTFRTSQHWLVLQGADHFEILQLKDTNMREVLAAFEARTGLKIDRPSGGEK